MGHVEIALAIEHPDMVQKAGTIQFLEMSFELTWNRLKDYLKNKVLPMLNRSEAH